MSAGWVTHACGKHKMLITSSVLRAHNLVKTQSLCNFVSSLRIHLSSWISRVALVVVCFFHLDQQVGGTPVNCGDYRKAEKKRALAGC